MSTTARIDASPLPRVVTILIVEDNVGDVVLVRQSLLGHSSVKLWYAPDGINAMRLLEAPGAKPDMILLDLNLPGMDGRALLSLLKSHPRLCGIPVIVLTGSSDPREVRVAYNLHANCYIPKPDDFVHMEEVMHRLVDFWVRTVRLPKVNGDE